MKKRPFRKGDKVKLKKELRTRPAFRRAMEDAGGPDITGAGKVVADPQDCRVPVRFPSGHLMVCDPDNLELA